jgi:hypothetical protein
MVNILQTTPTKITQSISTASDAEIALKALTKHCRITGWRIFRALNTELKNNRAFILQALTINPHLITEINLDFLNDYEIAAIVLQNCGNYLKVFSTQIRADYKLVKLAVSNYGDALRDADITLQNDYDLVLIAAHFNGEILRDLGQQYYDDEAVILAAITSRDWNLQQMAKNFVLASSRLKNNRDFILQAISKNGYIYPFLNLEFQQDSDIICSAANTNLDIMIHVDNKLRIEQEIVQE